MCYDTAKHAGKNIMYGGFDGITYKTKYGEYKSLDNHIKTFFDKFFSDLFYISKITLNENKETA